MGGNQRYPNAFFEKLGLISLYALALALAKRTSPAASGWLHQLESRMREIRQSGSGRVQAGWPASLVGTVSHRPFPRLPGRDRSTSGPSLRRIVSGDVGAVRLKPHVLDFFPAVQIHGVFSDLTMQISCQV
jgi:hypothetical protein